jgi:F-box-like
VASVYRRIRMDVEIACKRLSREYDNVLDQMRKGDVLATVVSVPATKAFLGALDDIHESASQFAAPSIRGTVSQGLISWAKEFDALVVTWLKDLAEAERRTKELGSLGKEAVVEERELSDLESLPNEMLRLILQFLTRPADLASLSMCSTHLNHMAQDDELYLRLLDCHFPVQTHEVAFGTGEGRLREEGLLWRDMFIAKWTQANASSEPIQGLRQCKACEKFFWGSANQRKVCRKEEPSNYNWRHGWSYSSHATFQPHAGKPMPCTDVVQTICSRNVKPVQAFES